MFKYTLVHRATFRLSRSLMNKRIMKKRIRQLLLAELALRFERTEDAIRWLETESPELDNRTPRDAISAGEIARVTLLLEGLAGTGPSQGA